MRPRGRLQKQTTWPVGQAVKTAASHAANMGSIPVRVTNSFLRSKKELTVRRKFDKILAVEKNGKEKKNKEVSFAYFSFQRKVSWC